MEQTKNQDKIKIAQLLQKLAILKNAERSEMQIAAMAEYLERCFYFHEVMRASEYILQRDKYYPGIDRYFELLRPIKTIEAQSLELVGLLKQKVRDSGFDYTEFKNIAPEELLNFVNITGWKESHKIFDKDAVEIFKSIINKPEHHFKTLGARKNEKIEQ